MFVGENQKVSKASQIIFSPVLKIEEKGDPKMVTIINKIHHIRRPNIIFAITKLKFAFVI